MGIFFATSLNMKKKLSLLLVFLLSLGAYAQDLPHLKESVFKPGEVLKYKLEYGFISAAEETLRVESSDLKFNQHPTIHLSAQGMTSSAFSVVYSVLNRYDSYID